MVLNEHFNEVFMELCPSRTYGRAVRVEQVPGIAVMYHVVELLEVAEADSDIVGGRKDFVGSSHLLDALLSASEVLSARLSVTVVRSIEGNYRDRVFEVDVVDGAEALLSLLLGYGKEGIITIGQRDVCR